MESESPFFEKEEERNTYSIEDMHKDLEQAMKEMRERKSAREKKGVKNNSHIGFSENMFMAKHHPRIADFILGGDKVLQLDEEKSNRLFYLEQKFIDGDITSDEFEEFKQDYIDPYFIKRLQVKE